MKKRALIRAVLACMVTTTGGMGKIVQAAESGELLIKPLTAKVVEKNPYMAKGDSNIHHDCYNTDSTD